MVLPIVITVPEPRAQPVLSLCIVARRLNDQLRIGCLGNTLAKLGESNCRVRAYWPTVESHYHVISHGHCGRGPNRLRSEYYTPLLTPDQWADQRSTHTLDRIAEAPSTWPGSCIGQNS
ncbi:hypothetical protein AG1IA_10207 [Rhizoctonia solani AG-1 IA]|uniref:Uncharacterized protein n=1 Tax=Thanatephorus cucumeris (strain AG1-IA) TaxID=983506 RepID=L8WG77_THACA|nr:hypothetical protein AG1IA_10207 [Rhizoctonia solani AG-1 IA]